MSEDEKFSLDQIRAEEDLQRSIAETKQRTEQRVLEQQQRMAEQQREHILDLEQMRAEHATELAETQAANEILAAETTASAEQTADTTKTLFQRISENVNNAFERMAKSSNQFVSSLGRSGQNLVTQGSSVLSRLGTSIRNAATSLGGGSNTRGRTASSVGQQRFGRSRTGNTGGNLFSQLQNQVGGALGNLFGGFRADGGKTNRGSFFQVAEDKPELYREGNRTYLIPSAAGNVAPPRANPLANVGSGGSSFNFTLDVGGITVTNDGSGNLGEQILEQMETIVIPKLTERIQNVAEFRFGGKL